MKMNGQLFKDLDALTQRIQCLSPSDESLVERMLQQLTKERSGIEGRVNFPARDLAKTYLEAVTEIPWIVRFLRFLLDREDCKPEWQHQIVLALVYLVRSDDLIPDDTPGGYGYIDDYIALRMTLAFALCEPDFVDWIVRSLSSDKTQYKRLNKECNEWMLESGKSIAALMVNMSAERAAQVLSLSQDISETYKRCSAWAAVNPESLEHRTKELIDDPRLPGPVLTHPVDDDALWSQWEFAQAEKRKEAMRKAEEERSKAAQKMRLWDSVNRYWRDRLRSPVIAFDFPGGGGVATDGHGIYITPKPG